MRLGLLFETTGNPELIRTEVINSLGESTLSYRGKGNLGDESYGCFQWTAAVRAFALLAVGTKLHMVLHRERFTLSGVGRSAAASLDYAIGKPTQWIEDIFGKDSEGRSIAMRVFRRENAGQKLAGPVRLAFAPSFFDDGAIEIYVNEKESLENERELYELFDKLQALFETKDPQKQVQKSEIFKQLSYSITQDAVFALSETELLEPAILAEFKDDAQGSVHPKLHEELQKHLYLRKHLSIEAAKEVLSQRDLLTLHIPASAVTALLIFYYLKHQYGLLLEIHCNYDSTSKICTEILDGNITSSLAVLSLGASSKYYESGNDTLEAFMLLPRTSLDLVYRDHGSQSSQVTTLLRAADPSGYPQIYLDRIFPALLPNAQKIEQLDADIAEVIARLQDKDTGGIIAFPYSALAALSLRMQIFQPYNESSRLGENIAFLSADFSQEEELAFSSLIKYAWYDLLNNHSRLAEYSEKLLSNDEYSDALKAITKLPL